MIQPKFVKRFLPCYLFLVCLMSPSKLAAEQSPSSTVTAAKRLVTWFSQFLEPFSVIGATAEREHFIDSLLDLNRALFDLEQEKRYVIVALKRRPLSRREVSETAQSLETKIKRLRDTLKDVAPQLRVAYRAGGDEAISLLQNALVSRAGVVVNLALADENSRTRDIVDAEEAVASLAKAQAALADAIVSLRKE